MHSLVGALIYSPAILGVCEDIVNMHNTTLKHGTACRRASILLDRISFHDLFEKFFGMAVAGRNSINVSILSVDEAPLSVA